MKATTGDQVTTDANRKNDMSSSSTNSTSAHTNMSNSQQQMPQPKRSQDVDELIHFVRNYQGLQRETTDLRLKRHALLPGIGRGAAPSGAKDPRLSNVQEEDRERDSDYSRTAEGYNSDSDLELELQPAQERRRTPSPPALWRSDPNPLSSASTSSTTQSRYVPDYHTSTTSDSLRAPPKMNRHMKLSGTSPRGNGGPTGGGGGGHRGRRITADVHQLPPIQRQDIPERPEAPAPGRETGGPGRDTGGPGRGDWDRGDWVKRHGEGRDGRPGEAGKRRTSVCNDSFTDRLVTHSDDEDGDPVDYIE